MATEKFNPISLTSSKGVEELLVSSKNRQEWDANCNAIMEANGGNLPGFWYVTVIASGLADRCYDRFPEEAEKQAQRAEEAEHQRQEQIRKDEIIKAESQRQDQIVGRRNALRQRGGKLVIKAGP